MMLGSVTKPSPVTALRLTSMLTAMRLFLKKRFLVTKKNKKPKTLKMTNAFGRPQRWII